MSTVSPSSDQQLDRAALAALYEETFKNLEEGTITEGRVVAVTKDKVVVDIGYKSEGMIPNDQFSTEELQNIKVGDRLQVYIEECEDADGNLVLSKEKADKMKIWEELEKLFNEGKSIDGKIVARIKGGMMVDIGVKAFLPGSQIDLHPVRDLDGLVGRTFPLKIIKINHRRGNVVVSRRVLLEETRDRTGRRPLYVERRAIDSRRGEEHHGLRGVHRPRRHRRAAPHHGHVLGPCRPSVGNVQHRRQGGSERPQVRSRDRAHFTRLETEERRSLDRRGQQVSRSVPASEVVS